MATASHTVARAHGKVILLGEHSVVYGHPALAGALSEGVSVQCIAGTGRLVVPAWNVSLAPSGEATTGLHRGYHALRGALALPQTSEVDLIATFEIPTGAGLGSSGALAVAVARALSQAHGTQASDEQIWQAAMASETEIHGKPSGLDHTVAQRGGFGLFTRGAGFSPFTPAQPIDLVIGHTGRDRDTKGRVARIAELLSERGDEVRARFSAIEKLVDTGREAIAKGALGELGRAMNENQRHLESLEVSCPEIERMCAIASDAGAVGAKLTGGGGGGCVIALAPGREAEVRQAWERAGFRAFSARIGGAQ